MSTSARARQARRALRAEGPGWVARRVVLAASRELGADVEVLPLHCQDVVDSSTFVLPPLGPPQKRGGPLRVGFVCTPPAAGSGGHTTLMRFVSALEAAGHTCDLYLYDRFHGDVDRHRKVVREWWPAVRAEVHDVQDGIPPRDAYVAACWETAHVLAARVRHPGQRLYLVQDFEPYFYGRGSEYALAEDTYRLGYRHVAVGHMVADALREHVGVDSLVAEFGCDQQVYTLLDPPEPRRDVLFYTRPHAARRGYQLGVLALQRFAQRHPEVTIHCFGVRPGDLPFPATVHARLTPVELNALYNRCVSGLALSFTNISLIAEELLAAGVVPVVNDSPMTRADLHNPFTRWSTPGPDALCAALCEAVERPPDPAQVAGSVTARPWERSARVLVEEIERCAYGEQEVR
jgi:hypothetical protein